MKKFGCKGRITLASLLALEENGEVDREKLDSFLNFPQKTVQSIYKTLKKNGWITYDESKIVLTSQGRETAEKLDLYRHSAADTMKDIIKLREFLDEGGEKGPGVPYTLDELKKEAGLQYITNEKLGRILTVFGCPRCFEGEKRAYLLEPDEGFLKMPINDVTRTKRQALHEAPTVEDYQKLKEERIDELVNEFDPENHEIIKSYLDQLDPTCFRGLDVKLPKTREEFVKLYAESGLAPIQSVVDKVGGFASEGRIVISPTTPKESVPGIFVHELGHYLYQRYHEPSWDKEPLTDIVNSLPPEFKEKLFEKATGLKTLKNFYRQEFGKEPPEEELFAETWRIMNSSDGDALLEDDRLYPYSPVSISSVTSRVFANVSKKLGLDYRWEPKGWGPETKQTKTLDWMYHYLKGTKSETDEWIKTMQHATPKEKANVRKEAHRSREIMAEMAEVLLNEGYRNRMLRKVKKAFDGDPAITNVFVQMGPHTPGGAGSFLEFRRNGESALSTGTIELKKGEPRSPLWRILRLPRVKYDESKLGLVELLYGGAKR
jgi:predicted transcriptional regulator